MVSSSKKNIEPTKSVYCYYFPEVRKLISEVAKQYPHEIFLQSISPGLDDFHEPVIEAYLAHMKKQLPGLNTYPHRYVSAGASEAIFHLLAHHSAFRRNVPLYVFEGEYEGYQGYGTNLGLSFTVVPSESDISKLPKGVFFISNPSARNGMIVPNTQIKEVGDVGHEIILDVSYAGLTKPHTFLVDHPAIRCVLVSLSKPFGIYYYRVGFCFTREEYLTLKVNKWFKNIFSLVVAKEILTRLRASELVEKYIPFQKRAVAELSTEYGFELRPSDVMILSWATPQNVPRASKERIVPFQRGRLFRFCLTPLFLSYEKDRSLSS